MADDDHGFIEWRSIRLETVSAHCWASADRRWVVTATGDGRYLARVQLNMEILIQELDSTPHAALDAAALALAHLGEQLADTLRQVR
jgi:hypothetical protein